MRSEIGHARDRKRPSAHRTGPSHFAAQGPYRAARAVCSILILLLLLLLLLFLIVIVLVILLPFRTARRRSRRTSTSRIRKRIRIRSKSRSRIWLAQQKRTRQAYVPTAPSSGCSVRVVQGENWGLTLGVWPRTTKRSQPPSLFVSGKGSRCSFQEEKEQHGRAARWTGLVVLSSGHSCSPSLARLCCSVTAYVPRYRWIGYSAEASPWTTSDCWDSKATLVRKFFAAMYSIGLTVWSRSRSFDCNAAVSSRTSRWKLVLTPTS